MQEHGMSLFPSPPNTEIRSTRLENLAAVLAFLDTHMFPFLPDGPKQSIVRSLYKPIATGVLNYLLIPSLPSSFPLLPPFLELAQKAVDFEDKHINMFVDVAAERTIKNWVDGVGGHYERKRRVDILEKARTIILHAEDDHTTFSVETETEPVISPTPIRNDAIDDQAWGFEDNVKGGDADTDAVDESGWGFDEDIDNADDSPEKTVVSASTDRDKTVLVEEDPAAAWGWNDDETSVAPEDVDDGSAWDDPWDEAPAEASVTSRPPTVPAEASSSKSDNATAISTNPRLNGTNQLQSVNTASTVAPPAPAKPKEKYLVSGYVTQLIKNVENVLEEGKEFATSKIIASNSSSSSSPGFLILQSAISVLDLFRALYPVHFGSILTAPERAMRFSNDCIYISGEVSKLIKRTQAFPDMSQKLVECKESLQVLGESWFEDAIVRIWCSTCLTHVSIEFSLQGHERQTVDDILLTCQGFTGTTEQDRYDECENAISRVLKHVRHVSRRWKVRHRACR